MKRRKGKKRKYSLEERHLEEVRRGVSQPLQTVREVVGVGEVEVHLKDEMEHVQISAIILRLKRHFKE